MLGLGDIWVLLAMAGSIAVTLVCVIFGVVTWNSGAEKEHRK